MFVRLSLTYKTFVRLSLTYKMFVRLSLTYKMFVRLSLTYKKICLNYPAFVMVQTETVITNPSSTEKAKPRITAIMPPAMASLF
jgi:hypothetical protein